MSPVSPVFRLTQIPKKKTMKSMNSQVNRAAEAIEAKPFLSGRFWRFRQEDGNGWRLAYEGELEALGWSLQANDLLCDKASAIDAILSEKMVVGRWEMFLPKRDWEPAKEHGNVRVDHVGTIWRDGAVCEIQMEDIDDLRDKAGQQGDHFTLELCERALDGDAHATWLLVDIIEQDLSDADAAEAAIASL